MTREEFYSQDRKERMYYSEAQGGDMVSVPLTKDGFEALVERACRNNEFIIDDGIRSLVAGYIHHIANNEILFLLDDLISVIYKQLSNNMTFQIDQECKARAKKEFEEKAKADQTNVIDMPTRPTPSPEGNAQV